VKKRHITIITVFPELHTTFTQTSLLGRAVQDGLISFSFLALSDFVPPKKRIDTPSCGPGAGMVIKADVAQAALEKAYELHGKGATIFFTPQGDVLDQPRVKAMAEELLLSDEEEACQAQGTNDAAQHLILFCGRYEGVDARIEDAYADYRISSGDYVLMGGDLPAQIFLESILRYMPGVVGKKASVENDSFSSHFLDWPAYGQPVAWEGRAVPEVLLSGDHAKIDAWRKDDACKRTLEKRFDWLQKQELSDEDCAYVAKRLPSHYAVLMHDQVLIGKTEKKPGTTSVTTIDVHDIARSCATYGIKKFFIVTPLTEQRRQLDVFFRFWHTSKGQAYNVNRFEAMSLVQVCASLDDVEAEIERLEGRPAIKVATSAKQHTETAVISYRDQGVVFAQQRPVLVLFGTGQGMVDSLIAECDYVLTPVRGFTSYNHLSVRCAVAIVLDRWIGLGR